MKIRKLLAGCGLATLIVIAQVVPVFAASANISHAYKAQGTIAPGSLVSLTSGKSEVVELATPENSSRLVGVAVENEDSLLAVDATDLTTQVANSGTVKALVSTSNGEIKVGDQISVSPFKGIGMKGEPGTRIIGLAQNDFSSTSKGAVSREIKDNSGDIQKVTVGYVRVSIAIGTATTSKSSGLQKLAEDIAGHPVSMTRVVLSAVIAIIALAALITLIYGAIFGSIIAVGRNPLAKFAIFRTLGSVLFMAFAMAAVALFTMFLLLR